MTDSAPTQPIQYAAPERLARRVVRRYAVTAIVLLTLASTYWWGPPAWLRAQVHYWQSRCAKYEAPPDAIVASKAFGKDGAPIKTSVIPKEWSQFYNLLSPPGLLSDGTALLHLLQKPNGEPVIVAVDFHEKGFTGGLPNAMFLIRAFKPGKGFDLPAQDQDSAHMFLLEDDEYRVHAGKLDPADPAHFTIQVDSRAGSLHFDGWVRDRVILEQRRASTPPPPTSQALSPSAGPPAR